MGRDENQVSYFMWPYNIVRIICFRTFNFRIRQAIRKYFNDEIFTIYPSIMLYIMSYYIGVKLCMCTCGSGVAGGGGGTKRII